MCGMDGKCHHVWHGMVRLCMASASMKCKGLALTIRHKKWLVRLLHQHLLLTQPGLQFLGKHAPVAILTRVSTLPGAFITHRMLNINVTAALYIVQFSQSSF